mmetsp:Transcript_50269/g.92891  ORF Transcript_50269/g.92891 Transcript_50269/m.92891 type:complete len:512 (+) Transcript_50269:117-1652(+)
MHATEAATAAPGTATPPPVRPGVAREQHGSHSSSPAPPGGKRLASDMRRMAAMVRRDGSQTSLGMGGQGPPVSSALGISAVTADTSANQTTTLEAVSQVQRQREQDRRLFDRRLLQLEQRVDTLLSEKDRDSIADWRKKLAEVNGSFSGLQGEVHGLARHLETLEEMLHGRNSSIDLLKQRVQETDQQVQGMEKRIRHCDTSMKEMERGMPRLRAMEQSLEENAQRLSRFEEFLTEMQEMMDLHHHRVDGLEAVREVQRFAPVGSQDLSQVTASMCEMAEQLGHLAQRASGFEATQVSLQHRVGEVAGRLTAMEGGRDFYEFQPAQVDPDFSDSHGGSEAPPGVVLKELRDQLDDLSSFVLELSAKEVSRNEFEALSDIVARQEETMDLYISYIKCVASDHSEQVQGLAGRMNEVEKSMSSNKFQLGTDFADFLNNNMQDLDPVQVDMALEHIQLTCLQAADDIASAVRLELQDMGEGLTSKALADPSLQGAWQLASVDGLNGDEAEDAEV